MEQLPLISVIVPVYKVEPYLDRCVASIVNQTYTNLEIILVDDGSPDNCGAMCDAWARKDGRIKVIHKENGGLSDARNAGMAIASGKYMGFVDSDDYISADMYQLLYDRMIADSSDMAACGVEMVYEDGSPSRPLTRPGQCVLTREEAVKESICENWLKQPVWYKLYKTDLVRDIPFPVGKYHEDVFWSYQAAAKAKKVSVFDTPCYFYTQRSGSIMSESYSLKRLDSLEAKVARVRYMQIHMPSLASRAKIDLWFSCMYATQMLMCFCDEETKAAGARMIQSYVKDNKLKLRNLNLNEISLKQCIWLLMSKISFINTCRIRNKLKIGF